MKKSSDVQRSLIKVRKLLRRLPERSKKQHVSRKNFLQVFRCQIGSRLTRIDLCRKIILSDFCFHWKWCFANTPNRQNYGASSLVTTTITGVNIVNVNNTSSCFLVILVLCTCSCSRLAFLIAMSKTTNNAVFSTFHFIFPGWF